MTETENPVQKQIKIKQELLPDGFEDIRKEPRILIVIPNKNRLC